MKLSNNFSIENINADAFKWDWDITIYFSIFIISFWFARYVRCNINIDIMSTDYGTITTSVKYLSRISAELYQTYHRKCINRETFIQIQLTAAWKQLFVFFFFNREYKNTFLTSFIPSYITIYITSSSDCLLRYMKWNMHVRCMYILYVFCQLHFAPFLWLVCVITMVSRDLRLPAYLH